MEYPVAITAFHPNRSRPHGLHDFFSNIGADEMIKKLWIIGIAMVALTAQATVGHSYDVLKMPTTEKIEVVDTAHFKILYQAPIAQNVPLLAAYCEEAYYVLTRLLGRQPSEKIRVFLTDNFDTHNGWATVVPRNTMAIYLAGTRQGSQIYQPGNYLRRTIYHEMMHVLSMDMRAGYNKALEKIFGKIDPTVTGGDLISYLMFLSTASPNVLAPNWYLEGISMYAETEFAAPGRGRSTLGDMIFRTAVKDRNLIPYSEWYLETPRWPYGSTAYWYGMRMIQYLSETSSRANPVGDAVESVSRRFLFNFNGGIQKVAQHHWKTLADQMLQHERQIQSANYQKLEAVPFTSARRLTPKDIAVQNVRFAGRHLFFTAATEEKRNTLYTYDLQTGKMRKLTNAHTPIPDGALSATTDGHYLFYTNLDITDTENLWYEVRRYDTRTGRDIPLTRHGRYRAVDVSPDGRHLAAVTQRQGIPRLVEVPIASAGDPSKESVLASTALETDLAAPRYSPDGRDIAYVEADGDMFHLKIYNRTTGQYRTAWRTPDHIIAPTWHPGGKEIVFGCDANGVYNLYRLPLDGATGPAAITHVWGGLFFPSFSEDGRTLAAVNYDGFGPHLVTIAYAPQRTEGIALPVISPAWRGGKTELLQTEARQRRTEFTDAARSATAKKYNSLTSMRPDFWTPWATVSTYGAQGGLAAAMSDPARHQELVLVGGYETEYQSPIALVRYTYRGLKPDLTLYGGLNQRAYPDLLTSPDTLRRFDYAEETQFAGAAVSFPLWTRLNRQLTFKLGYEFLQRDVIEEVEDDYRGIRLNIPPTLEDQGSVWGRLDYFSGTAHGRSISIEDGFLISVGAEHSSSSLGGEIDATRALADLNGYISMPWFKNHVLKISGTYGTGHGDEYAQGLFGLGGFGSFPASLTPGIARNLGVRGYNTNFQTGQRVVRVGAAYRFPVLDLFKGLESGFPLYNRDLRLEVFYEGGRTYDDNDIGDDIGWLHSAGAEINYGMSILRFIRFAPGIGVAYAPQRDDRDPDENEAVAYISVKLWSSF
jgi:hypothetical protein